MSIPTCNIPQIQNWAGACRTMKYPVLKQSPQVHIPTIFLLQKWVYQRFNLQIHICCNKEIYSIHIPSTYFFRNSKIVFSEFTVDTCTSTICGLTHITRGLFSRVGACKVLITIPYTCNTNSGEHS